MKNKSKWLVISLVIAAIAILGVSSAVVAAGPQGQGICDQTGQGAPRGLSWGFGWGDETITAFLNMTREEICAERQAGKSLVQIASKKGFSEDELVDAIMAQAQTALQARVSDGTLTQEEADARLETMQERITAAVNRTTVGPNGNQRGQGMGKFNKGCGRGQMNRTQLPQ